MGAKRPEKLAFLKVKIGRKSIFLLIHMIHTTFWGKNRSILSLIHTTSKPYHLPCFIFEKSRFPWPRIGGKIQTQRSGNMKSNAVGGIAAAPIVPTTHVALPVHYSDVYSCARLCLATMIVPQIKSVSILALKCVG